MDEIKLRDQVIDDHLTGKKSTGQPMTNIELICLQFRKIGELLMLSALCVHKAEYQSIYRNIEKEWDPNKIKKRLENIHPDFYPTPFKRVIYINTGKQKNSKIIDNYLSKDECISLIGRCGNILHAFNPYNDNKIFKEIESVKSIFPEWQKKIRILLKTHEIKLIGTNKQLWVYMAYGPKQQVYVEERVPINK